MLHYRGEIIYDDYAGYNINFNEQEREIDKLINERHQEQIKSPLYQLEYQLLNETKVNNAELKLQNAQIEKTNKEEQKQVEILNKQVEVLTKQYEDAKKSESKVRIRANWTTLLSIVSIIIAIVVPVTLQFA